MIHTNKQAGISSEGGHYALFYFRGERDPHVVSRPGLPERLNVFRFLTHVVHDMDGVAWGAFPLSVTIMPCFMRSSCALSLVTGAGGTGRHDAHAGCAVHKGYLREWQLR